MIDALKRGDSFAFEQIYTHYCNKVYAYFKKKTASEEDARDLMQLTFLKLWQYRASLSADYLPEQHLFHISKTVFIDYLRKQNKQAAFQQQAHTANEYNTHSNPAASYFITTQVNAALSLMPAVRRKIFELNRLQGYSYQEVAELLSISVKAVDNNLTKALKQLRKQVILSLIVFISFYL